jgi:hypothetical protein
MIAFKRLLMAIHTSLSAALASGMLLLGSTAMSADAPPQVPKAPARTYLCRPQSDSQVPVSDRKCPDFGHSWTSEDIQRTGATTVGDALRLLDPTLTVHQ